MKISRKVKKTFQAQPTESDTILARGLRDLKDSSVFARFSGWRNTRPHFLKDVETELYQNL